jgi:hypothetical protein
MQKSLLAKEGRERAIESRERGMHTLLSMSSLGVFVTILTIALSMGTVAPDQAEAARAFFVFGDSLVDNGNNNYLATTAQANWPPYGIDYPTHRPTGRFSNGLNLPDIISELIVFP